jgi:hypothetical protein
MHDRQPLPPTGRPTEEAVDEAEEESFPSSDPQSSWAGPDEPPPVSDGPTD